MGRRATILLANDDPDVTMRFWRMGATNGHEQWDVKPKARNWAYTDYGVRPAPLLPPLCSLNLGHTARGAVLQ